MDPHGSPHINQLQQFQFYFSIPSFPAKQRPVPCQCMRFKGVGFQAWGPHIRLPLYDPQHTILHSSLLGPPKKGTPNFGKTPHKGSRKVGVGNLLRRCMGFVWVT